MTEYSLVPHPDFPPRAVENVTVAMDRDEEGILWLEYHVESAGTVIVPEWGRAARADELWRTTCFELFFQPIGSDGYYEFNFSPSSQWAAYQFDGYRLGMREAPADNPDIVVFGKQGELHLFLEAEPWPAELVRGAAHVGLTAVIEEIDGTKSYWALAHAPGPPDFHNPDCFIATLPAPTLP